MEDEIHAAHSSRSVRTISSRRPVEYIIRLRNICLIDGRSEPVCASQLHVGLAALWLAEHHGRLPWLQMVRVQDKGQLPARVDPLRRSLQRWHYFRADCIADAG